jgi:hypothetical protein
MTTNTTLTNMAALLMMIDKNTVLGTSYLKNLTVNTSTTVKTSGIALNTFLYAMNVIDMGTLTSNTIVYRLNSLPIHKKLIFRTRAYTECSVNTTILMTLSVTGITPVTVSKALTQSTEDIL